MKCTTSPSPSRSIFQWCFFILIALLNGAFSKAWAQPSNHPTGFTATTVQQIGNLTDDEIILTWTDATGATAPTSYLILIKTASSPAFTAPTDGVAVADGTGAANIAQGVGTYTFSAPTKGIAYNFIIYPYTGTGTGIDYKTDGTAPTSSAFTFSPRPSQPSALSAIANGSGTVDLSFAAPSTVTNAKGYAILRRSDDSQNNLVADLDGVAPSMLGSVLDAGTTLIDISDDLATTYEDTPPSTGISYFYTLIPYNWDETNPETHNYNTNSNTRTAIAPSSVTVTLIENSMGTTDKGIATSPLSSPSSQQAILGFNLSALGSEDPDLNSIDIAMSNDPSSRFENLSLFQSDDDVFDFSDTEITGAFIGMTPTAIRIVGLSETITDGSTHNYFIVADVISGLDNTTANIQPEFSETELSLSNGFAETVTITGQDYAFQEGIAPTILTTVPGNGNRSVLTNTSEFTIEFDEPVQVIGDNSNTENQLRILLSPAGTLEQTIAPSTITVSGSSVTIPVPTAFTSGTEYRVSIGNNFFADMAGNAFAGITAASTEWVFRASNGVIVTTPSNLDICSNNEYNPLGDITIAETMDTDFNDASSTTVSLILGFADTGFEFRPGSGSVSVDPPAVGDNDIDNIELFVSATQLLINYTLDNGSGTNSFDKESIIISGLQIRASIAGSTTIVRKGGTADQAGNNGLDMSSQTYANVTSTVQPDAPTGSNFNLSACEGSAITDLPMITGNNMNVRWYSDAELSSELSSIAGNLSPTAVQLGFTTIAAGAQQVYVTQTDGCESSAAEISLTVHSIPVGEAGTSSAICPGESVILGGSPTLSQGTTDPYTYAWTDGTVTIPDESNPSVTPDATTTYNLVIMDGNSCSSVSDAVTITVNSTAQTVTFSPPDNSTFTNDGANQLLSGSPSGGIFSGPGVVQLSSGDYVFSPSSVGVGSYIITYTATLSNGCTKAVDQTYEVSDASNLTNLLASYCEDDERIQIIPSGTLPASTVRYSNTPFSPFNSSSYIENDPLGSDTFYFVPQNASIGENRIFVWVDGTLEGFQEVTINSLPDVDFFGISEGDAFCPETSDITLTGSPSGGNFTIGPNDLTGGILRPSELVSGSYTVTYTFTDGNACSNSSSKEITILPAPDITFSSNFPVDAEFCQNTDNLTINALEGTSPVSSGSFSGPGIFNTGSGGATFSPRDAYSDLGGDGINPVIATVSFDYTNSNNCSIQIRNEVTLYPLPNADFDFVGETEEIPEICFGITTLELDGRGSGTYSISGSGISPDNIMTMDGDATIDPTNYFNAARSIDPSISSATFNVEFTIAEELNPTTGFTCSNTVSRTFTVVALDAISIEGIEDDQGICAGGTPITITFSPSGGSYSINGAAEVMGNSLLFSTEPSVRFPGNYTISYSVATGNGCEGTGTKTITLHPTPEAGFSLPDRLCVNESASFEADDPAIPGDYTYTWLFGDTGETAPGQMVDHLYTTQGSFPVTLTVTQTHASTGAVCENVFTPDGGVRVGEPPVPSFSFSSVCLGASSTTEFTSPSDASIESYDWDFGDGSSDIGNTTPETTHQYTSSDSYTVTMTARTINGCPGSVSKRISILPRISLAANEAYQMVGRNGWFDEDVSGAETSIWQFGTPSGTVINSALEAWGTNLTGAYTANANAYVNSPCFDLSALDKPNLALDIWSDTQEGSDGAVLQYSIDDGINWTVLGSETSGINWYTEGAITGEPGGQAIHGWSRREDNDWSTARHPLDGIGNLSNVRFRVAFGSNGDTEFEGFAFRGVSIGERNKISLLEHFTDLSSPESTIETLEINRFADINEELIKLEYHLGFSGENPLHGDNKIDVNARAATYGIASVPRSKLDGVSGEGLFSAGWGAREFGTSTLTSSPVRIESIEKGDGPDNMLNIRVNLSVLLELPENTVVHVAVVEKVISSDNIPGQTSGTDYINVVKALLPNAVGTELEPPIAVGESLSVEVSWLPRNVYDLEQLAVVAFVQNENTLEVLQSKIEAMPTLPTIITGINDTGFANEAFSLYPNPAKEQVTLQLGKISNTPMDVMVYDGFGRIVSQQKINKGSKTLTLYTRGYTNGPYFVRLLSKGAIWATKKMFIMH